jgi:hypothetical protein
MKVYVEVEVYLHSFLISALGWRWVIGLTTRLLYLRREEPRVYIKNEAGWATGCSLYAYEIR